MLKNSVEGNKVHINFAIVVVKFMLNLIWISFKGTLTMNCSNCVYFIFEIIWTDTDQWVSS